MQRLQGQKEGTSQETGRSMNLYDQVRELERKIITEALKKLHSVTRAAKLLGIERTTLRAKMKAIDLEYRRCFCDRCKKLVSDEARKRANDRAAKKLTPRNY